MRNEVANWAQTKTQMYKEHVTLFSITDLILTSSHPTEQQVARLNIQFEGWGEHISFPN